MPAHCSWRTRGVCRFVKGPGFQCDVCNLAPSKTALLPSKAFQPGLLVDEGPSRAVFPEQGGVRPHQEFALQTPCSSTAGSPEFPRPTSAHAGSPLSFAGRRNKTRSLWKPPSASGSPRGSWASLPLNLTSRPFASAAVVVGPRGTPVGAWSSVPVIGSLSRPDVGPSHILVGLVAAKKQTLQQLPVPSCGPDHSRGGGTRPAAERQPPRRSTFPPLTRSRLQAGHSVCPSLATFAVDPCTSQARWNSHLQ